MIDINLSKIFQNLTVNYTSNKYMYYNSKLKILMLNANCLFMYNLLQ